MFNVLTCDWLRSEAAIVSAITITEIGRMHKGCQDQALGANEPVPFALEDFSPGVEAALSASHRTGFVDWLSMIAAQGSSSRPIWTRTCLRKAVMAFSHVPLSFH